MEQIVPIADIHEIWIEGNDPASLVDQATTLFAAQAVVNPGMMILDLQIAGGAGGSQYRVGFPFGAMAVPGSVLASQAHADFRIVQGECELNRVAQQMITAIATAHPTAVVRYIQFGSANGDGAHLVGVVWYLGPDQSPFPCTITRVWDCKDLPRVTLDVPAGVPTLVQEQLIPCTVQQLGRAYLVWWRLTLREDPDAGDDTEPSNLRAEVMEISAGGTATQHQIGVPIKIASDLDGEVPAAPWVADASGQVLVIPGVTGPAFTAGGPNAINLNALNDDATVNAICLPNECCYMIVEIAGDLSALLLVPPNQPVAP